MPQAAGAARQLVLIPSYNTGPRLIETVADALRRFQPVWVVIDGSTDGTAEPIIALSNRNRGLRVFRRAKNGGKGAAVLDGLREAAAEGFTHVLVMDADGQHPAAMIPRFLALSRQNPDAMILGVPIFDATAPWARILWRRVSNVLANIETGGAIGDSLFGFRVYPVASLLAVMDTQTSMRRFDFDVEAAVRLSWRGVRAINQPAPVRYLRAAEGGVSHFRYARDNALLTAMHVRLLGECICQMVRQASASFCEQKEAKKLCFTGPAAAKPARSNSAKVFWLLFFKKVTACLPSSLKSSRH